MSTDESPVPRALAIAWGLDAAPTRGPRRELSHDAIVAAAIDLADAGGLAAVTMAKVAEALGFTTMSLYRYVSSKDELVALMLDAAAAEPAEIEVTTDDWRQGLRDVARLNLAVYERHPWFLDVPLSLQSVLMPNTMRFADATYRAMRTLPADAAFKQNVVRPGARLAEHVLPGGGPAVSPVANGDRAAYARWMPARAPDAAASWRCPCRATVSPHRSRSRAWPSPWPSGPARLLAPPPPRPCRSPPSSAA